MRKQMKYVLLALAALLPMLLVSPLNAEAKVLDHIHDYDITVDVLEDGSAEITYDISWEVLDSDSYGPLEWVTIGLPNSDVLYTEGLSDNIDYISLSSRNAEIYFNDSYYEGEVVDFSYKVNISHMYLMDPGSGYTEFNFTPGWFDEIEIDSMIIKWNADKVSSWAPDCLEKGGYLTWEFTDLAPGETRTVSVSYPNDACAFTEWTDNYDSYYDYNDYDHDSGYNFSEHSGIANVAYVLTIIVLGGLMILLVFSPLIIPILVAAVVFKKSRGFTTKETKITRTKIEYYPTCPGCGAARADGFDNCQYCGRDMIKSKEVITEEQIPEAERAKVLSYKADGTYRYTSDPHTYVRVHSVVVPVHHAAPVRSSSGSSHSSSSSHHSSCAHSSCAHSSCACACACACAGGGRAGCTTKDFYNTGLKLRYLKRKKK